MVAGCLAVELSLRSPPPLMPPPLAATTNSFPLTYTPRPIAISDNSAPTEATSAEPHSENPPWRPPRIASSCPSAR